MKKDKSEIIDSKLERAEYKVENGDLEGAEKILEEIAFTYNEPRAWRAIGEIKFKQIEEGKDTIGQALDCFYKSIDQREDRKEGSKKDAQKLFAILALGCVYEIHPKTWPLKSKFFKNEKEKSLLLSYEMTIWNILRSVNNFCFDNKEVYGEFLGTIKRFSPTDTMSKITSTPIVSKDGYELLSTDMYEDMRVAAAKRVDEIMENVKQSLKKEE
jgi:hypothetical protein